MQSSHVIATGTTTAALAAILHWATTWPLQSMDANTSMAAAGLIVAAVGGFAVARFNRNRGNGNPVAPFTVKE